MSTEAYDESVTRVTTEEDLIKISGRLLRLIVDSQSGYRRARDELARRQGEFLRVTTQNEGFQEDTWVRYMTEEKFLKWFREEWENQFHECQDRPEESAEEALQRIKAGNWELGLHKYNTWLDVEWIGEEPDGR